MGELRLFFSSEGPPPKSWRGGRGGGEAAGHRAVDAGSWQDVAGVSCSQTGGQVDSAGLQSSQRGTVSHYTGDTEVIFCHSVP